MHGSQTGILEGMVDRLAMHATVSYEDRAALLNLPYLLRTFEPGSYLVREGDVGDRCPVLLAGLACRHKISKDGGRQIVGIQFPGEILNLQQLYIDVADHNVQALTRCEVATLSGEGLRMVARDRPSVSEAFIASALIEGSIMREWLLNIGRRDARTRVAHLLCEFAVRRNAQKTTPRHTYKISMTQEQLSDALGLTAVHINRTLKVLETEGLIIRDRKQSRISQLG